MREERRRERFGGGGGGGGGGGKRWKETHLSHDEDEGSRVRGREGYGNDARAVVREKRQARESRCALDGGAPDRAGAGGISGEARASQRFADVLPAGEDRGHEARLGLGQPLRLWHLVQDVKQALDCRPSPTQSSRLSWRNRERGGEWR